MFIRVHLWFPKSSRQSKKSSVSSTAGVATTAGPNEEAVKQVACLRVMQFFWRVWHVVLFGSLIVLLLRVSHQQYPGCRIRYGPLTSSHPFQLLDRLMPRRTPFQFSILTLLALKLAVAIVCGTLRLIAW